MTWFISVRDGIRTSALSEIHLSVTIVNSFQPLVIVTKGSFIDVAEVLYPPLYNFHLPEIYTKKLNRNRKTKKLQIILHHYELILTCCYITYICLFKVHAISKPVLQHKGTAIFLEFFYICGGYMSMSEESLSKLWWIGKSIAIVFEEIYLRNWNILQRYYVYTYFFILATELTNLNLKTNERWDP